MHDANGTPLKKGDKVLLPAVIIDLDPAEDWCNVQLESTLGRRPDGEKEFMTLNTGVVIKVADANTALGL